MPLRTLTARVATLVGAWAIAACAGGGAPPAVPLEPPVPPQGDASAASSARPTPLVETSTLPTSADVVICPQVCRGRASAEVELAIQSRAADARRCYNHALGSDRTLRGSILVHLRVAEDGSLCETRILESNMPLDMAACTLGVFGSVGAHYPPPVGGCIEANVPMRFEPMPADAGAGAFN